MGTTIDSLDISISTSVEKSNKAIDSLIDRLEKIQKSILSISKNAGLSNIADSLNAAAGNLSPAFKNASSSADKMVKNISDSLDNLLEKSKSFKFFGSDQKLDSTIEKYSNDLEKAIVKQEKLAVTSGVDSKKYLEATVEVKSLINILDSLKAKKEELAAQKIDLVQYTTNLSDLSKMTPEQLDEWFKTLPSIQNAARDMEKSVSESFDNVSEKIVEFSGAWNGVALPKLDSLEGAGEQATDFANALASLKDITPRIDETDLSKLQNKLKSVESQTEQLRYELEKEMRLGTINDKAFDNLTVKIQESENQAERLRERIAELSRHKSVSGLTASFSDFVSALKSGVLRLNNLLKSLLGVNKASKRFNGSLSGGLKTILKYGLGIRSLYILVNKLRSAIKEGMKNLVQYSDEVNSSVSLLWNSLRQTKNALATGIAPAFNALTPILNNLIQLFIRATNAVNQLTSALLGKTTWIKAKQLTDDYRDSLNKAGKAAKGAIRAFDELSVITTQDNGGAGDETPAEDMFETVEVETDISDFAKHLKEMWRNADFTDLGQIIGNKIKNALDGISWNSVYEGAKNFGKGLATFLNGLISPGLFGSIGTTIASGLNTAIYAALSFGENFDFKDFGLSIAAGINNFFATFDFKELAHTLNVWVDGIEDTIKTAIDNIEWNKIWEKLKEFSFEIDIDTAAVIAVLAAPALVGGIAKLTGLFAGLKGSLAGLAESFLGTEAAVKIFSAPFISATAAIAALVTGLSYVYATNEKVRESFSQAISSIKEGFQPTIEFITQTLLPDLQAGWKRLVEILAPFGEFLESVFTDIWQEIINPTLTYIGEIVLPKVAKSFENLWNNVLVPLGNFIADIMSPIIEFLSGLFTSLWKNTLLPLAEMIIDLREDKFGGLVEVFNNSVIPVLNSLIKVFQFLWNNVLSPIASFLMERFKPVFDSVFKAIGGIIEGYKTMMQGLIGFITGIFTLNWEKAWEGVKNIFKGIFNGLISITEGAINFIISGINVFLGGFDKIVSGFGNLIGLDLHIPLIPEISIPRFAAGGFPEDGLFFANRTELVGQFSNGQTVVANNEQIIAGIKQAAYEGFKMAMAESGRSGTEVVFRVEGDPNRIFKVTQEEADAYFRRTGRPAFSG